MSQDADDDGVTVAPSSQIVPGWELTQYPAAATSPDDPVPPQLSPQVLGLDKRARLLSRIEEALNEPVSAPLTTHLTHAAASVASVTSTSVADRRQRTLQQIDAGLRQSRSAAPGPAQSTSSSHGTKRPSTAAIQDENTPPTRSTNTAVDGPDRKKARVSMTQQQAAAAGPLPLPQTLPIALNIRHLVKLSDEQRHILKLVGQGKSVFFTGSAGTGKSVLLREIIRELKSKYKTAADAVAVTASTGIAACNVGGVTLHSFAGFGLGTGTVDELVKIVKRKKSTVQTWTRTKALVIDEISMVDGDLFDKTVRVARIIRKKPHGMGGLQVVICGDFFQLPPVTKAGNSMVFAFESQTWNEVVHHTFNLGKVFRQKDQTFVDMLNELRLGAVSAINAQRFRDLSRPVNWGDGIEPTELFPMRWQVDKANMARLRGLAGRSVTFSAVDGGPLKDTDPGQKLLSNLMAPEELQLKVDCQVMLIKNTDETLVNGSMGKVIAFHTVAAHNCIVRPDNAAVFSATSSSEKTYPVVRFAVWDAVRNKTSQRDILVQPESWKVEGLDGKVAVSRIQLPLILAWAMSVHKSQGQTLDRVRVDAGRTFEKGQAYVALSRATSLQGLQVLHFDAAKVMAHPRVVVWSKTLDTFEDRK